jgi:hypothetical protein
MVIMLVYLFGQILTPLSVKVNIYFRKYAIIFHPEGKSGAPAQHLKPQPCRRPEKPKRKRPAPGTSPADRAESSVKPSSICHNDIGPPLGRLAAAFGHDPIDLWRLKENSGRRLNFQGKHAASP